MTNREVGGVFWRIEIFCSSSAVAKIKERSTDRLAKVHALKRRVEKIERYMSNVKARL